LFLNLTCSNVGRSWTAPVTSCL